MVGPDDSKRSFSNLIDSVILFRFISGKNIWDVGLIRFVSWDVNCHLQGLKMKYSGTEDEL